MAYVNLAVNGHPLAPDRTRMQKEPGHERTRNDSASRTALVAAGTHRRTSGASLPIVHFTTKADFIWQLLRLSFSTDLLLLHP
jgi:hypothetical protein